MARLKRAGAVLIVEDEPLVAIHVATMLNDVGFSDIRFAHSAANGLALLSTVSILFCPGLADGQLVLEGQDFLEIRWCRQSGLNTGPHPCQGCALVQPSQTATAGSINCRWLHSPDLNLPACQGSVALSSQSRKSAITYFSRKSSPVY